MSNDSHACSVMKINLPVCRIGQTQSVGAAKGVFIKSKLVSSFHAASTRFGQFFDKKQPLRIKVMQDLQVLPTGFVTAMKFKQLKLFRKHSLYDK